MTTIRTVVLALLLGAGLIGSALAAEPAQPTRAQAGQAQQVAQAGAGNPNGVTTDAVADAALRAEMAERLDPRTVALIAAAIGAVGIVAGIRRRRAMEAAPELV